MLMRALLVHTAHEIAGAARIRHSLRPLIFEREPEFLHDSDAMRRENANTHPTVIARLDRATQYSRGANDRIEKPRRTGSPACAEDDSFVWSRADDFIAMRCSKPLINNSTNKKPRGPSHAHPSSFQGLPLAPDPVAAGRPRHP